MTCGRVNTFWRARAHNYIYTNPPAGNLGRRRKRADRGFPSIRMIIVNFIWSLIRETNGPVIKNTPSIIPRPFPPFDKQLFRPSRPWCQKINKGELICVRLTGKRSCRWQQEKKRKEEKKKKTERAVLLMTGRVDCKDHSHSEGGQGREGEASQGVGGQGEGGN